jgi:hypothetical protein
MLAVETPNNERIMSHNEAIIPSFRNSSDLLIPAIMRIQSENRWNGILLILNGLLLMVVGKFALKKIK